MKNWVVYIKPDNKVDAVEDDHTPNLIHNMQDLGWKIIGYVAFKDKADAIQYCKEVFL